ncbi:hypothetical protein [Azospirillum sp.]|uniref:hypothetical protein n=1 Tax=Azospirillum sp. TaxID=34012 RepID=UPI002D689098|nr:hypothetical protein [Azospirillum sp.]HYF89001.1 hypothetical protein [Azospirillum sp.]
MTREERREIARNLHAEGLNDAQIGVRLGISKSLARLDRKAMGLPAVAPGGRQVLATVSQLREWVAAGLTRKEMAERCGASPMTISRKLWEIRLKDGRAAKSVMAEPEEVEEDDEPTPTIVGDDLFLSAFAAVRVALPTNSRRAETSDREGRIYGLPVMMSAPSSLCMGG